jgi:hypothetical protein
VRPSKLGDPGPHISGSSERVLEQRVALGEGREIPAVQPVLALEPGGADATDRAAAREYVECRDDLCEVRDVAVRDPSDERPQPETLRDAGEVPERRVALEHVLPLPADLRDLEEVVHQPEALEARLLSGARHVGERGGRAGRMPWPIES